MAEAAADPDAAEAAADPDAAEVAADPDTGAADPDTDGAADPETDGVAAEAMGTKDTLPTEMAPPPADPEGATESVVPDEVIGAAAVPVGGAAPDEGAAASVDAGGGASSEGDADAGGDALAGLPTAPPEDAAFSVQAFVSCT